MLFFYRYRPNYTFNSCRTTMSDTFQYVNWTSLLWWWNLPRSGLDSHRLEATMAAAYLGCETTQLPFGQGSRKTNTGTENTEQWHSPSKPNKAILVFLWRSMVITCPFQHRNMDPDDSQPLNSTPEHDCGIFSFIIGGISWHSLNEVELLYNENILPWNLLGFKKGYLTIQFTMLYSQPVSCQS